MWARTEGFTKDQLTEFDHLMSMVSSTHINKSKLSNVCTSSLPMLRQIMLCSCASMEFPFYPLRSQFVSSVIAPILAVVVPHTCKRGTAIDILHAQMREIDRGSFGKIFKSTYEGRTVAVKQLANQGPSTLKAKMRELLLELRVLVRIEHANIVKFYGTATDFSKAQANKQPYVGELLSTPPCHKK